MKKYNLSDLYVVNMNINNFNQNFLCEYNHNNCKLSEIFTKHEIKFNEIVEMEPLRNYYSILGLLSGFYQGDLQSLFNKYIQINKVNIFLNYDSQDVFDRKMYYFDDDTKKVSTRNIYYLEVQRQKLNQELICVYNGFNNTFKEVFTHSKIENKHIIDSFPLFDEYQDKNKISLWALLNQYNQILYNEILGTFKEEDIIEELQDRGIYEESKIYQKRKDLTVTNG